MTDRIKTGADLAGACEGEQIADLIDFVRLVRDEASAGASNTARQIEILQEKARRILAEIEARDAAYGPPTEEAMRQVQLEYIIRCRVSGGVTGTRESILKSNGITRVFEERAEAEAVARRMTKNQNGPFAVAHFEYWVEAR